MAKNDKDSRKSAFVAGILDEVGDYLGNSRRDPSAGIALGANISGLARRYEGGILDDLAERGAEKLKKRAAERRGEDD